MLEAEYISVTQFAQKFGKDVGNVRKLIKDGRIPAIKIGNQWQSLPMPNLLPINA